MFGDPPAAVDPAVTEVLAVDLVLDAVYLEVLAVVEEDHVVVEEEEVEDTKEANKEGVWEVHENNETCILHMCKCNKKCKIKHGVCITCRWTNVPFSTTHYI